MTATQTSPSTARPDTVTPEYTEIKPPTGGARSATPVKARRINLLPAEIGKQRAQAKIKFYVFGGLGVLVVLLAGLYVMKTTQVSAARQELSSQQDQNAALQSQIDDPGLQAVVQKQADVEARSVALGGAVSGEVSLPAMLNQLAIVIPDGTWLTSLNFTSGAGAQAGGASAGSPSSPSSGSAVAGGSPGAATTAPAGGVSAGPLGTLQVNGSGLGNSQPECSHDVSAVWLQTMQAWPAIESVWVSTSTKSGGGLCNVVDFTSDMEVSSTLGSGRSTQFLASAGASSSGATSAGTPTGTEGGAQ